MSYCLSIWGFIILALGFGLIGYILGFVMAFNKGVDKEEAVKKQMEGLEENYRCRIEEITKRKDELIGNYKGQLEDLKSDLKAVLGKDKSKDSFFRMKKD